MTNPKSTDTTDQRFEDIHVFHYPTHAVVWHVTASTEPNEWAESGRMEWCMTPAPGYRWALCTFSMHCTDAAATASAERTYREVVDMTRRYGEVKGSIRLYVNGVEQKCAVVVPE